MVRPRSLVDGENLSEEVSIFKSLTEVFLTLFAKHERSHEHHVKANLFFYAVKMQGNSRGSDSFSLDFCVV